ISLFLPILLGTAREGRQSEKVANFVLREIQKLPGVETELIDVRDFILDGRTARLGRETNTESAQKWSDIMQKADGLVIVTPEYDHGYPGELKMMLDIIYDEYARKPVGFCGVSAGSMGGSRAVEQLRLVAIEFQMVPIHRAEYFSNVGDLFDEQGDIKEESYHKRMEEFFQELHWYANALKQARESTN